MAKKRYYQSTRDRMSESRGEERYLRGPVKSRRYEDGFYEGPEGRERQEYEDSMMIREDRYAIANLPQQVMIKPYPRRDYEVNYGLDDTIRVVDNQMSDDVRGSERHGKLDERYPEKY
jgi:hypothetical protein